MSSTVRADRSAEDRRLRKAEAAGSNPAQSIFFHRCTLGCLERAFTDTKHIFGKLRSERTITNFLALRQ